MSGRQRAFQAATSPDKARAAVRHALLVSTAKIKVKLMCGQMVKMTKHFADRNARVIIREIMAMVLRDKNKCSFQCYFCIRIDTSTLL